MQDLHPRLIQNLEDYKGDYQYYANDELHRLLGMLERDIENVRQRQPELFKLTALMRINLPAIEALFKAAKDYVEAVEGGIGEDSHQSVPYLYT